MSQEENVLRTVGNWRQFFKPEKQQAMLLEMIILDNKWDVSTRLSYEQIMAAMTLRGSKCLHDTDVCIHNTRKC